MKQCLIVSVLICGFLAWSSSSSAQVFFNIGYGAGFWHSGLPNLEAYAYRFNNAAYGNFQKQINIHPYFHGVHFSFGLSLKDWGGVEWNWTNRHKRFEGLSDSFDIFFKTRVNTFGWGFFLNGGKRLRIGINAEAGYFTVAYKLDSKINDEDDVSQWTDFYEATSITRMGEDKALVGGSTLYAVYTFGKKGGFGIRPYIHWEYTPAQFDNYNFFLNHSGITLIWQIGGNS